MVMITDFTYRTGSEKDLAALKELGLASFGQFRPVLAPEHWQTLAAGLQDEDRLRALIARSTVFVCEGKGQVVGAAYFVPSGHPEGVFEAGWCTIRRVGVHPSCQGRGIARQLTQLCIRQARATGETFLTLHTSEMMDAARHLYESLGFTRVREIEPIFGKRYWLYALDLAAPAQKTTDA